MPDRSTSRTGTKCRHPASPSWASDGVLEEPANALYVAGLVFDQKNFLGHELGLLSLETFENSKISSQLSAFGSQPDDAPTSVAEWCYGCDRGSFGGNRSPKADCSSGCQL
jgi:hypothetical protein